MNLQQLALFQKIVEKNGLAAAGRELGMSATTVSERLAALESYYGVSLLNRTTRAINLTEEGRVLLDGARSLLTAAENLENKVRYGSTTLSGSIKITAPLGVGQALVEPVITAFLDDNPQTSIELFLTDGNVNLVDGGFDLAIRFGNPSDSSLRIRKLGENHRYVCASPEYINRFGAPQTPTDLEKFNCLIMRFGIHLDNVWHFRESGKDTHVTVSGNRIVNDGSLAHDWCLQGHGIALKSMWDIRGDIRDGRLVRLLAEFAPPPSHIYLLFPPGAHRPKRINLLADKLADAFKSEQ